MPPYGPQRPVRVIPEGMLNVLRVMAPTDVRSSRALRAFGENFDPAMVVRLAVINQADLDHDTPGRRYHFRLPDGAAVEIVPDSGTNSTIRVDLEQGLVRKSTPMEATWGAISREAHWLGVLPGDAVPTVHGRTADGLTLSYEGEPVNRFNLPLDWRAQAEHLLAVLAAARCSHNDLFVHNIVVAEGRLKLIDFGWSTVLGEAIPAHWPVEIGEAHRVAVHVFDDRKAIYEALGQVEASALDHFTVSLKQ